jgi:hypothetical protein
MWGRNLNSGRARLFRGCTHPGWGPAAFAGPCIPFAACSAGPTVTDGGPAGASAPGLRCPLSGPAALPPPAGRETPRAGVPRPRAACPAAPPREGAVWEPSLRAGPAIWGGAPCPAPRNLSASPRLVNVRNTAPGKRCTWGWQEAQSWKMPAMRPTRTAYTLAEPTRPACTLPLSGTVHTVIVRDGWGTTTGGQSPQAKIGSSRTISIEIAAQSPASFSVVAAPPLPSHFPNVGPSPGTGAPCPVLYFSHTRTAGGRERSGLSGCLTVLTGDHEAQAWACPLGRLVGAILASPRCPVCRQGGSSGGCPPPHRPTGTPVSRRGSRYVRSNWHWQRSGENAACLRQAAQHT